MKNKILKITTLIATLCTGVMLNSADAYASGPSAGEVYENPQSGKKEYCPEATEFNVTFAAGVATVTDLDIACAEDYDAVMLPGVFIREGEEFPAIYEIAPFRKISDEGKGVVIQDGATVLALEDNLQIDYIRFDSGAVLEDYSHAFRGWERLTDVEGFIEAIEPGDNDSIDMGNTFYGCSSLKSLTLDFGGNNASFYQTFSECNKLKTLKIKNANVSRISQFAVRGDDAYSVTTGVNMYPMDITFENITFPENDEASYLSNAFWTVTGKITFKQCKAGTSSLINFDDAFSGSKGIKYKSSLAANYNTNCPKSSGQYTGGNIEIVGAKAYSTNRMFSEAEYGVITLNDFITKDTREMVGMFLKSKFVDLNGIDTWTIGNADLSEMFKQAVTVYDTDSEEQEQIDYLNDEIMRDLRTVDFSSAVDASEMMCFSNTDYIADYSGLDFSGIDSFKPVDANVPFVTPHVAPRSYNLPYDEVYYQTLDDTGACGGYRLTRVANASSGVAGDVLETDKFMTGQCAKIKVINTLSGEASEYNVIGGYKLSEYLDENISYFNDTNCKIPASMSTVLEDGNNVVLHINNDGFDKILDDGIEVDLGTITGNIKGIFGTHTTAVKLIDYNPVLSVIEEDKPASFNLPDSAKNKAEGQFYNVGIAVYEGDRRYDVKSITRSIGITIPLPDHYDHKGVTVLHYNKTLDNEPEFVTANVDDTNNTVQFFIDSFSDVLLLYNEAESEPHDIKVKWVDDGNYRNRCGIIFDWTATYEDGIVDTGTVEYNVKSEYQTTLSFDVYKSLFGESLESISVDYTLKSDIAHRAAWDSDTSTLTLTSVDATKTEDHVVKIDFTDVSDNDFRDYVGSDRSVTLTVSVTYDDETTGQASSTKMLASNYKIYEMPYTLTTVTSSGATYTDLQYSINMPDTYNAEINYVDDTITVTKEKDVYGDYVTNYTVTGFFTDNNNKDGKRPDEVKVKARAKFGDKEWTNDFGIVCRTPGYDSYQISMSVPGSCNGIPRDSLVFEPDPVEGYKITVSKVESNRAWIEYELDESTGEDPGTNPGDDPENPTPTSFKRDVTITFLGDDSSKRPSAVLLHLQDSNGGNQIIRPISVNISNASAAYSVDVPTDDTYVVTSTEGFDSKYSMRYDGLSVIATYSEQSEDPGENPENPTPTSFKRTITCTFIGDQSYYRPQAIVVTIQNNNDGSQILKTIPMSDRKPYYEVEVEVPTDSNYTIISTDGFSANYQLKYDGLAIVATYQSQQSTNPGDDETPNYKYTQNFSLEIKDNENEDGSRPKTCTLTVSDGKGNTKDIEIDISSGKKFTKQIGVPDETTWTISKVAGFPERYKVSTSGNNATVEYTPEKIEKSITVKFEEDGDNVDQTRPTSIQVYVKNGESTLATVTVDSSNNFSSKVNMNKYREGVEASYSIDCEDIKNYSKSIEGDTITFKFTGTLTKEAQAAEDAKKEAEANGTDSVTGATTLSADGSSAEGVAENDMSLENFDWIDYANRYPDLKRAYGYNKEKLYAHYIRYGLAEGRYATFTGKYNSVSEDVLAAYFPDDYKYAVATTNSEGSTTETDGVNTETVSGNSIEVTDSDESSVSENTIEIAEPTDGDTTKSEDGVVINEDGTTTEKMTSEDGTVTEIIKDSEGNIISTKQYKTGDARDAASYMFIMLGVLSLLASAYAGVYAVRTKRIDA